jgi:N utilization substance protein A
VKQLPKNKALVIVPGDQLSLAIGKDGQNVRLATKLTGWKIDIRSAEIIEKEGLDIKKEEVKEEKEKTEEVEEKKEATNEKEKKPKKSSAKRKPKKEEETKKEEINNN